jgi:hypothetical protein
VMTSMDVDASSRGAHADVVKQLITRTKAPRPIKVDKLCDIESAASSE